MDKHTLLAIASLLVNVLLLAMLIYMIFFSSQTGRLTGLPVDAGVILNEGTARRANTQKSSTKYRIAIIKPMSAPGVQKAEQGIIDAIQASSNFTPEFKIYDGNGSRTLLRSQIEEAVEKGFDLIAPIGSAASQMVKEITQKRDRLIPVVFSGTGDPVKLGLVESPERSGNNLTGVAVVGQGWIKQMMDLVPLIKPNTRKVLIPFDPTGLGGALEQYFEKFEEALRSHGIDVVSVKVFAVNEISTKVIPFMDDSIDMVLILPDAVMLDGIEIETKACETKKIPTYVAMNLDTARRSAAMSFGYSEYEMGVNAGVYILRILQDGEHPSNIPVNPLVSTYRFILNRENARKQGLLGSMNEEVLFLMENTQVV